MKYSTQRLVLIIHLLFFCSLSMAQKLSETEMTAAIDDALKVEGARVTLPVSAAINKEVFTPEFVRGARDKFNNFHFQMGGDHALYYSMHLEEFMPSAFAAPNRVYKPLERNINPQVADLKQSTSRGDLTLNEYMNHPMFRAQSMIMVHKGKVVYEAYPGMKPTDLHLTASTGKITVGLVIAQLIKEGKVNLDKPITHYVPELKGTVWDEVTTYSVANMTTGLDNEETIAALLTPDSAVTRFIASITNSPRATTGEVEDWLDVARDQKKLTSNEPQGTVMRYASINTTVLTQLIENVEKKPFTQVFEDRVWSKLYARRSIMFNLTPNGTALAVGLMAVMPEDYARFGMQFTPSWSAASSEQIVDDSLLDIFYKNVDKKRFQYSSKRPSSAKTFNETAIGNAIQFDYIWDDGAMAKSGNLGQMFYIDPKRDFVSVYFSTMPFVDGYGEFKAGAYQRAAAKFLAGE